MRKALCVVLLLIWITGCRSGAPTPGRDPGTYPETLREADVVARLKEQGLTAAPVASNAGAVTPFGKANSARMTVDRQEFSMAVFATGPEAAQGLERGLAADWPEGTTLLRWKNIIIIVTGARTKTGAKIVNALQPVADRLVDR